MKPEFPSTEMAPRFFLKIRVDETYLYVVPDKKDRKGWSTVRTQVEAMEQNGSGPEELMYMYRNLWFRISMVWSGVIEETTNE